MCVLRNGPLFREGDLVRWEFRQFSKKLSCRAKLKKCRKKSYGVRAMGKKFFTIINIYHWCEKLLAQAIAHQEIMHSLKVREKSYPRKLPNSHIQKKMLVPWASRKESYQYLCYTLAKSVYCVDWQLPIHRQFALVFLIWRLPRLAWNSPRYRLRRATLAHA